MGTRTIAPNGTATHSNRRLRPSPNTMKSNTLYNLMTQITQEARSLWRIKNEYMKDTKSKELKAFWKELAAEKEALIEDLKMIIRAELE